MASYSTTTTAAQGNMEASAPTPLPPIAVKRKRSLPGHPDPDAEVIALSPRSLLETNRFVCEICGKGFQRDQNLQLHRRGHNLPWRLKQKPAHEVRKKVYVCPEPTCVHHDPARALGDLTGIKKHFSRKHGEKKWKCEKCTKRYAVQSDWKAHQKICGTREYRCDCGTLFSRRDSFITHRAFCDALAEENAKTTGHIQLKDHPLCSNTTGTGISTSMEVPSSPLSQLTGDALTSSEVSNPTSIFTSTQSSLSIPESSLASVTSTSEAWMKANNHHRHTNGSIPTTKGPGLSLCLGTSTGPGPPLPHHGLIGNPNAGAEGADPGPFYMIHNPSNIMNGIGSDTSSSIGSTSMIDNIFNNGYLRHDSTNNSISSVSSYAKEQNIGDHIMQQSYGMHPSSRFNHNTGMADLMNDFRSANAPPKTSQTSSSAPMSATALLQKAAQMGATISDSSLFQKMGMGEKPSMMMEHRQSSMWASSMTSNMPMGYPKMSHGDDIMSNNTDGTSSNRNNTNGMPMSNARSMDEYINLMYRDMPGFGKGDIMQPSNNGGSSNHGKKFMNNNMIDKEHLNMSSNTRKSGDKSLEKHEGGEVSMVDFLGVGGSNNLVMHYGGNPSVTDILNSHRDLENINQFNSIVNMDRSKLSYQNNR